MTISDRLSKVLDEVEVLDREYPDDPNVPRPGDVVVVTNDNYYASNAKTGARAVIDSAGWIDDDDVLVCFSASAFRDGDYVSCSGGPLPVVKGADLVYAGTTLQRFWRWADRPRAGGGVDYDLVVALWEWAPKSEVTA